MTDKGFWIKKPVSLPNEPVLAEGYFSKKGNYISGKRYFRLYNNLIYYFDVHNLSLFTIMLFVLFTQIFTVFVHFKDKNSEIPKGYINIDFDLHFEVIRIKSDKNEILGTPRGLRLDRFNAKTEISTNDEELILKWRDILRNRIN